MDEEFVLEGSSSPLAGACLNLDEEATALVASSSFSADRRPMINVQVLRLCEDYTACRYGVMRSEWTHNTQKGEGEGEGRRRGGFWLAGASIGDDEKR